MPWSATLNWENAKRRASTLRSIREFFYQREVIEVETPLLSYGTITDVHLDAFTTSYEFGQRYEVEKNNTLYLQTSPEFAMKRLLASGYQSIFQLTKAFRNEEFGRHHNPEFTILEWYRIGFDHFELMDELQSLLLNILGKVKTNRITYQEAFTKVTSIDPLRTSEIELLAFISKQNVESVWLEKEDKDTLLQYIFSQFVEAIISKDCLCFVYNFPSSQASLAKISSSDNRVADRFECYFQGVELANGFHELTCAETQKLRFVADNAKRNELGLLSKPIDENFIAALASGIPDCAGVALGIDRLIMLLLDKKSLKDVISLPIERA